MSASLPSFRLLTDYVAHYAAVQPDAVALLSDDDQILYRDLGGIVDRWARAIQAAGAGKGDAVGVLGNSRPECFLAFLACARAGSLYLGLNPKYSARELAFVVGDARPKLVLGMHSPGDADLDEKMAGIARELGASARLFTREHVIEGISEPLSRFLAEGDSGSALPAVGPADPVALVYTSGSTGTPKGALLGQRGMIRTAAISWETWYGSLSPLRTIAQHPINHVGWLVCECVSTLVAGGTIYFRERFNGAETLSAIERHRLNLWIAFPSMLILAADSEEFRTADLSSLRRIALGSMASVELMRKFQERTPVTFSVSYGLTEASGGAVTYTPDNADLETIATTIGRGVPGAELRVVDAMGDDVPPGEPGELLVRDESLFVGYLGRPDATAAAIDQEGWLHTGDMVSAQPGGTYRMVGRLKEMFKSGGYNVYPTEIEGVLSAHPLVSAACVVPAADELWGEIGVAFVVLKPGAHETEGQLREYARARLANYKVPKSFAIRSELPRLPNGKFDKLELRKEAAALHSVPR